MTLWLAATAPVAAKGPEILTADVERFYRLYETTGGHPFVAQLDAYLAEGSEGLHQFAKLRNLTGARIAETLRTRPEVHAGARRCLAVLPGVRRRTDAALRKLGRLYPEAKSAPVTLLVGRGRPVGITSPSGVSIALEALCAVDFWDPDLENRFVRTIVHEYGHIQQSAELQALEPGQPAATVLRMSLMEGAAEFTAELLTGQIGNYQHLAQTRGREAEFEAEFVRDMAGTDLSLWLYNQGASARPGDLGYWVGYRIVKAYYANARDKRQALRDIYELRDPEAFLARSGWKPAAR